MEQGELTGLFCARPQSFAWFLGAGASATAGLPTATDILWDIKRRYYCREENQDISRQDLQSEPVRTKIQNFMASRGFPALWADDEYPAYFEKIFGDDKERQRRYLKGILAEDKATLAVGNRVLGGMLSSGLCRAVFTTNFDSVVEKAVAEVSGQSLSAYHLDGAHAANQALNNEEFPIYCKLHGDFRYESLKNLPADLAVQNTDLAECLRNASNRFGFIVTGYSGRDRSIINLFRDVLDTPNCFPHGFFWTGIKGSLPRPEVDALLQRARAKGVAAHFVPIETFDSMMLRLWRNITGKPAAIDAKVRKTSVATVHISLPQAGRGQPLVRLNALPIQSPHYRCLELSFRGPKNWEDVSRARAQSGGRLVLTKGPSIWCWGDPAVIRGVFGSDLVAIAEREVPTDLDSPNNLYVRGFIEEALCKALARGKPLRAVMSRYSAFLAVSESSHATLQPLLRLLSTTSGTVPGILSPITESHPVAERVTWAEAVRISIDFRNGCLWLLLEPDIAIEPSHARKKAVDFLDQRKGDRYNQKYNDLLDAWVQIVLATAERNIEVTLSPFENGTEASNPVFRISTRTAFTKRFA